MFVVSEFLKKKFFRANSTENLAFSNGELSCKFEWIKVCNARRISASRSPECRKHRSFFSSRRRHTRCLNDWSSDVCSSDLAHHVHRHCAPDETLAVRTEFLQEEEDGSLEQQAQELDADGYSSYLLLANLLQDENRYATFLEGLGHAAHRSAASDELLFTAFFVVVLNVFCALWPKRLHR